MIQTNLRGELTVARSRSLSLSDSDILSRMAKFLHISSSQEMVQLRDTLFPPLVCTAAAGGDVILLQNLKDNVSYFFMLPFTNQINVTIREQYYITAITTNGLLCTLPLLMVI